MSAVGAAYSDLICGIPVARASVVMLTCKQITWIQNVIK